MENHTAKHFVLQLSSLISLYLSLTFLVVLLFGIINILYPDAANAAWETQSAIQNVRVGIAVLVVFFPTYLILTRIVNKSRRNNPGGMYLTFTKWLIYLSLLISGLVLLGDLVTVIMTFLNGEITERFVLKATAVLVVVGAGFHYYMLDARGFWLKNEEKSILFAIGVTIMVAAAVAFGFTQIGSPSDSREERLDAKQIEDLRLIQSNVQQYYYEHDRLPENLEEISSVGVLPTAPEGRAAYRYIRNEGGFELCGTFSRPSLPDQYTSYYPPIEGKGMVRNPENWQHSEGEVCFKRVVTAAE